MTTNSPPGLTAAERDTLAECEAAIQRGLHTFVEVGQALATIRDNRLYRQAFATFEEYCEQRWQISRQHSYRLLDAYEIKSILSPMGDTAPVPEPANERQVRPLSRMLPHPAAAPEEKTAAEQEIRDTWTEAVRTAPAGPDGTPKVTAKHVEDVVRQRTTPAPEPAEPSKATKAQRRPITDAFRDAAYNALKAAESVQRLTRDDRWKKNAPKVDPLTRDNLRRAHDLLSAAVNNLEGEQ